jgi:hypothetical protein
MTAVSMNADLEVRPCDDKAKHTVGATNRTVFSLFSHRCMPRRIILDLGQAVNLLASLALRIQELETLYL